MVQVDILLKELPRKYDISINNTHVHDVIVGDRRQSHDIYIYNLVDRQGIYGDELDPLIFHLTESTIECLLDVSLLESALLYRYDDRLINSMDDYPVFVLEHGGGYNYFSLKESSIGLRETVYANLKEQITKLKSDVDIALVETMDIEPNNMTLSTSGDITNIAVLKAPELSAKLQNQIIADMSKVCEIMLNASGIHWFDGYIYEYDDTLLSAMDLTYPKMSLVSTCGNAYMKFSFDIEGNDIGLSSIIPDFVSTVNLKDAIRNTMQLETDAEFEYKVVCSCNPISASLEESEISLKVITHLSSSRMSAELTDWIAQNVRTATALGVISESNLETSITEEMEAYYGLGRYDSQYLYYWDNYTISNMSAEIINKSQTGSVDM